MSRVLAVATVVATLATTHHTPAVRQCAAFDTDSDRYAYNVGKRVYSGRYVDRGEQGYYTGKPSKLVRQIVEDWPIKPHRGLRFKCR